MIKIYEFNSEINRIIKSKISCRANEFIAPVFTINNEYETEAKPLSIYVMNFDNSTFKKKNIFLKHSGLLEETYIDIFSIHKVARESENISLYEKIEESYQVSLAKYYLLDGNNKRINSDSRPIEIDLGLVGYNDEFELEKDLK